jgi:glycosyltransferase involved in cell wall biosynthesis
MRICMYTESALPMIGGQEIVVDALAREFLAAGHQTVVLAQSPRSAYRKADHLLPYPVVRHPRFISTRRLIEPYAYFLKRVHRSHGFDILHCHSTYPTGYLGTRVARSLGVPVVITSHGGDVTPSNSKLSQEQVLRRHVEALSAADALVAISDFTAESYRRLAPASPLAVRIPNGVDTLEFSRAATRPDDLDPDIQPGRYVLFLGRLSRRKGVDLLVEAFAKIPREERPLLVIAGDGEERPALERKVAELDLTSSVRFAGVAERGRKTFLLQNSLVSVAPSREWESFHLVILESFAAGRPVIATRLPGLTSLVLHERTGWLVDPESSEALAAAIRTAIADVPLREKLGREARAEAVRFDWKVVARSYLDLFASLSCPC